MSETSFETLRAQAVAIGLTGSAVAEYVVGQQNAAREERCKERELERIKVDAKKEHAKFE